MIWQYHICARWRLRVLMAALKLSCDDVVLDAGCGDGYISFELAKYVKSVVGVDIDDKIIAYNKRTIERQNLSFICYDISMLSNYFDNEIFDKVICIDTLEHSQNFLRIIEMFSNLLKTNGILYATIPIGAHGHFEFKDEGKITEMLCLNGMKIVKIERIRMPPITATIQRGIERIKRVIQPKLYSIEKEQGSPDLWSETVSFQLIDNPTLVFKIYKVLFPVINLSTLLDKKPYEIGGESFLIMATKKYKICYEN